MKTRSPRASLAATARATRSGSDGAGRSPGQSTPRSDSGSRRVPSKSRAGDDPGSVNVCVMEPLCHAGQGRLEPMRVVMAVDKWPGVDSPRGVADVAREIWAEHSDGE